MTNIPTIALAASLLLAPTAFAADAPATTVSPATVSAHAGPAAKDKLNPNLVICHYEVPIGSRLGGHKVCTTQFDRDQAHRDAQSGLNQMSQHGPMVH
jgi:Flp pilus assembly protein CpaB